MAKNLTGPKEEGETPLDDLSGALVDIKTRQELDELEHKNNNKAYAKYLLMNPSKKALPMTYQSLCEIHKDMFGEVWSWAGEKRTSEKNLGVSPVKIGSEIHRFLHELHQWEKEGAPPSEIAAKMHHRLVAVHPFENGNGRWARLVTNLYLHKNGQPLIQWPTDPDFVEKVFRPQYLAALKSADKGDYKPLLKLHREHGKNEAP